MIQPMIPFYNFFLLNGIFGIIQWTLFTSIGIMLICILIYTVFHENKKSEGTEHEKTDDQP